MIYFKDYENYHRTKGNKMTHIIGVPLVMFSLLGLLSHISIWAPAPDALFRLDGAIPLLLFGIGFAFKVDAKLAVPFSLYTIFGYLLFRHLSLPVLTAMQIVAWVFQLVGHYKYEKKAPALLTSIEHIFIGPLWIFSWMIGYYKPSTNA